MEGVMATRTDAEISRRHLAALAGCAALGAAACEPGNPAPPPIVQTSDMILAGTIAALTALASSALHDSQLALVAGYTRDGDGGGGVFRWSTASRAAGDSVMVFRPQDKDDRETGRWLRDLTGQQSIAAEAGGCRDDDETDNGPLIRRVITAASACNIREIGFLGRGSGVYACSSKVVDATAVPGGIVLRGLRPKTSQQGIMSGCIIKYTGTDYCFDVRNANGITEIEGLAFQDLSFWASNDAGGMFSLNFLDAGGGDYTPTDTVATPNYLLKTDFRNCHIEGSGDGSTATGIRARKAAQITVDEHCFVTRWRRGIHLNGVENSVLKGRYIGNGRHIMLEASGTFGNDTTVAPQFMGPTRPHGESSYALYDTAKATTVFPCFWEMSGQTTAQFYIGGAGPTFYNPNFGSEGIPVFELGPSLENGKIIGINARRARVTAPIIPAPETYEGDLAAAGEPWWLTIYDAHAWVANIIGTHPRIRYIHVDPASAVRHVADAGAPWIGVSGAHSQTVEIINSSRFPARWVGASPFSGIDGMVADASVPTGYVIRMRTGAGRGWYRLLTVGKHVHIGDWLRVVIRHRNLAPVTAGSWRYSVTRNARDVGNGALPSSARFTNTTFSYRVTDFSNGDMLGIGIADADANGQALDIDSMTIAICAPAMADTNGATLRQLEMEVNRLKAVLRSANQIAG
jgi:hypothetical protein